MALSTKAEERAEKGRSETSTPTDRLAYWISQVSSPFFVALPLLAYVCLSTAPSVLAGLLWWAILCVGLAVPMVFIWFGVKSGRYSDIHVSRRSQRLVPLLVGLICIGSLAGALFLLQASRPLIATLVAVLLCFGLATLITHIARYKISFHIGAATGAVMVCCLLAGPLFLLLTPLVVLIAWARWKLEAHTPLQALCGASLAAVVTFATFWFLGLR